MVALLVALSVAYSAENLVYLMADDLVHWKADVLVVMLV